MQVGSNVFVVERTTLQHKEPPYLSWFQGGRVRGREGREGGKGGREGDGRREGGGGRE